MTLHGRCSEGETVSVGLLDYDPHFVANPKNIYRKSVRKEDQGDAIAHLLLHSSIEVPRQCAVRKRGTIVE